MVRGEWWSSALQAAFHGADSGMVIRTGMTASDSRSISFALDCVSIFIYLS